MKRVVSSSIVTFLILIAAAAIFFYLRNYRSEQGDPLAAIPSDAVVYLSADPVDEALENLLRPDVWGAWSVTPAFRTLQDQLTSMRTAMQEGSPVGQLLTSGRLFLSLHVTGAGTFDFLFLKAVESGDADEIAASLLESSGENAQVSKREFDGLTIHEIRLSDNRNFTWSVVKGVFMGSFTPFLVEDALRQQKVGRAAVWSTVMQAEGNPAVHLNFTNLPAFLSLFTEANAFNGYSMIRNFAGWYSASVFTAKDRFAMDGVLESADTLKFVHCLMGQTPVKASIPSILPSKTASVLWYGASNFELYLQKLQTFHRTTQTGKKYRETLAAIDKKYKINITRQMTSWASGEYALVVTEPSSANYDNSMFAVFHTANPDKASRTLSELTAKIDKKLGESTRDENYQGHTIKFLRLTDVMPALYGNHFKRLTRMFYTISGDHVIFANQASALRNYIDEIRAGHIFATIVKGLIPAQGANFMLLVRPEASLPIFRSVATTMWRNHSDKYREVFTKAGLLSFTVISTEGKLLASTKLDLGKSVNPMARMLFSVEADSSVSVPPLILPEKTDEPGRIVFQDDSGVLHMADNTGAVLWRTKLEGTAHGKLFAVDYFRNGKTQILFNTRTHLHLIDDEGKPVGNYPIRLPAVATNAMTLAPLEGSQEKVIYIACENKRIYAYLINGRPLQGWNFQSTTGTVTTPVHAFASGGKRYLLIGDREGTVTLVNSFGDVITGLSQGFTLSENSGIYSDTSAAGPDWLVTTDAAGNVVKISRDGAVSIIELNAVGASHGFLFADADADGKRDFIFASGREITAYDQSMVLLYRKELEGEITGGIEPVMLPGGEAGYALTSASENRTWMMHMNGTEFDGFPVRGSMGFTTGLLNSDGRLHLVTGSRNKGINVYLLD
jgi:hypothetical protein